MGYESVHIMELLGMCNPYNLKMQSLYCCLQCTVVLVGMVLKDLLGAMCPPPLSMNTGYAPGHEGYILDWKTWVDVQYSAVESAQAHSQNYKST